MKEYSDKEGPNYKQVEDNDGDSPGFIYSEKVETYLLGKLGMIILTFYNR